MAGFLANRPPGSASSSHAAGAAAAIAWSCRCATYGAPSLECQQRVPTCLPLLQRYLSSPAYWHAASGDLRSPPQLAGTCVVRQLAARNTAQLIWAIPGGPWRGLWQGMLAQQLLCSAWQCASSPEERAHPRSAWLRLCGRQHAVGARCSWHTTSCKYCASCSSRTAALQPPPRAAHHAGLGPAVCPQPQHLGTRPASGLAGGKGAPSPGGPRPVWLCRRRHTATHDAVAAP